MSIDMTKSKSQQLKIYWSTPNIICYLRALMILVPLATALTRPIITLVFLIGSISLDVVDGALARHLKQESRLGQMLDYAIDRATLSICCIILAVLIPNYWWFFSFILMLDLSSHFAHLYRTVFCKQQHHKKTSKKQNLLIRLYYDKRQAMFFACASHDLFLAAIYTNHFFPANWDLALIWLFIPGFIFKTVIHILQITESMHTAVEADCN
jgi:phosphatidylglycerophosphate synthase